jgi:hypothetical protein
MTSQHRPDLTQYIFWVANLSDDELAHLMRLSLTPYFVWGRDDQTVVQCAITALNSDPYNVRSRNTDLMFDAVRLEVLRRWQELQS